MKKLFLLLVILFSFAGIFAADVSFFNIETYLAYQRGCNDEAYYYDGAWGSTEGEIKSLLEWNFSGIGPGIALEGAFRNFYIGLDSTFLFDTFNSKMYDSDFSTDGIKTNYAIYKYKKSYYTNIELKTGYIFQLTDSCRITPIASVQHNYMNYESENIEGWYGRAPYSTDGDDHAWNSEYAHHYPDGVYHIAGINYESHIVSTFAGVNFGYDFNDKLSLSSGVFISPFTYIYAFDRHLGKSGGFTSDDFVVSPFKQFRFNVEIEYWINNRFTVYSKGNFQLQGTGKGDYYENRYISSEKTGAGFWKVQTRLGVKVRGI